MLRYLRQEGVSTSTNGFCEGEIAYNASSNATQSAVLGLRAAEREIDALEHDIDALWSMSSPYVGIEVIAQETRPGADSFEPPRARAEKRAALLAQVQRASVKFQDIFIQLEQGVEVRVEPRIAEAQERLMLSETLQWKRIAMQGMSRCFVLETRLSLATAALNTLERLEELELQVKKIERSLEEVKSTDSQSQADIVSMAGFRASLSGVLDQLDQMSLYRTENTDDVARYLVAERKRRLVRTVLFIFETELENGHVKRRVEEAFSLPAATRKDEEEEPISRTCCICEDEGMLLSAPCRHMCCKECWLEWLSRSKTCPLCRQYVHPMLLQDRLRKEETQAHADKWLVFCLRCMVLFSCAMINYDGGKFLRIAVHLISQMISGLEKWCTPKPVHVGYVGPIKYWSLTRTNECNWFGMSVNQLSRWKTSAKSAPAVCKTWHHKVRTKYTKQ
ncbi:hypothetical protein FVE85_2202 [Porphyridium purpureum]|uniref:RING-type domain-containing protein n=1 Tax=Porphyridium purpureum TaxID=35688 RepID=A0A5J4Z019_PORPP|nr:hypothetical protein FVE85_2202 [Porphyridium purpureum]|eukprot:POR3308..scf209_3